MDNQPAPLSINLDTADVKTGIPIIADNTWALLRLENVQQVEQPMGHDKSKLGTATVWSYKLVNPVPTADGTTLNPGEFGSNVFERIQLYAKPDAKDPKWFAKKIATRQDALLGTGDPGNILGKPARPSFGPECVSMMIGREMFALMKAKTDPQYKGNDIADVKFPGDMVGA